MKARNVFSALNCKIGCLVWITGVFYDMADLNLLLTFCGYI